TSATPCASRASWTRLSRLTVRRFASIQTSPRPLTTGHGSWPRARPPSCPVPLTPSPPPKEPVERPPRMPTSGTRRERRSDVRGGELDRVGRRTPEGDGPQKRRRQRGLVLPGDGTLAARQQGQGPSVVRQGRGVDGEERAERRGVPPLPGGSSGAVGC